MTTVTNLLCTSSIYETRIYASVGGASRHTVVVVFVCVYVILQRAFLGNRNELSNESCNATTAQHSTTAKLARFLPYKALLDMAQ